MKKIIMGLPLWLIAVIVVSAILSLTSCSKSSTGSSITPLGGYTSSDAVASANLVAYFPFNGNSNDSISGNTATTNNVTYNTGIRGLAYQGATGGYATVTPSAAFSSLGSFAISVWFKLPAQPANGDPGGMFFLSGTSTLNELLLETESYSPVSMDSVKIHHGFTDLGSPNYQGFTMESFDTMAIGQWTHLVMSYDGASSTYTFYENGIPRGVNSAWSSGMYVTPTIMYDGPLPVGSGTPPTQALGSISFTGDAPHTIYIGTWPPTLYGVSSSLGANGCYMGQMDELRVFNRALSGGEVAGLYLNGRAGR
jgi:hypothetical protein